MYYGHRSSEVFDNTDRSIRGLPQVARQFTVSRFDAWPHVLNGQRIPYSPDEALRNRGLLILPSEAQKFLSLRCNVDAAVLLAGRLMYAVDVRGMEPGVRQEQGIDPEGRVITRYVATSPGGIKADFGEGRALIDLQTWFNAASPNSGCLPLYRGKDSTVWTATVDCRLKDPRSNAVVAGDYFDNIYDFPIDGLQVEASDVSNPTVCGSIRIGFSSQQTAATLHEAYVFERAQKSEVIAVLGRGAVAPMVAW